VLLLLVSGTGLYLAYLYSGQPRYRRYALLLLKWTVLAGLGFFAGLALERLLAAAA
jgi:hypothetical protein